MYPSLLKRLSCPPRHLKSLAFLCTQSQSQKSPGHYDVIVAGGGMVGTTMASALAKNQMFQGKSVLLLECAPQFRAASRERYSNRVSALSESTVQLIKSIGAWEHISSVRFKPVLQMQVWDACSDAVISFRYDEAGKPVAYIVENDLLLEAVYRVLQQQDNVSVLNEAKIEWCRLSGDNSDKTTVSLKNGDQFTCSLLIGADGYNSLVRKEMGVNNFTFSYDQMGVVATIELDEAENNVMAWQRFLPTGPVALLPLSDNLSSLVWTTTPEHAKSLLKMEPQQFIDALNHAYVQTYSRSSLVSSAMKIVESVLGNQLGGGFQLPPKVIAVQDNSRAAFPLGLGHASTYVKRGVALIGDAAHRVHPLAGQGVNLGFGDVHCLVEALAKSLYAGAKLGDLSPLLSYERDRLIRNVPIMAGIHGLQQLYCTNFAPIVALRSIGLRLTNAVPPLKNFFISKAIS